MTFTDQYALANTPDFAQRCGQAMITAAVNVQAELVSAANHTNRANFATLVLRDPEGYQPAVARAVASNSGITATPNDGDIQFTVNSMWDAFAGTI